MRIVNNRCGRVVYKILIVASGILTWTIWTKWDIGRSDITDRQEGRRIHRAVASFLKMQKKWLRLSYSMLDVTYYPSSFPVVVVWFHSLTAKRSDPSSVLLHRVVDLQADESKKRCRDEWVRTQLNGIACTLPVVIAASESIVVHVSSVVGWSDVNEVVSLFVVTPSRSSGSTERWGLKK